MDKDPSVISPTEGWGFWKWVKVISPIALLVVIMAIASFYFLGKFMNLLDSQFPELKVIYAALQKNYPDRNDINVNVRAVENGNGAWSRNVLISLVNSASTSKNDMTAMARVACSALQKTKLRIDTLTMQPVTQISTPVFNASYAPDAMSGSCDWWMNTSTA